MAKKGLFLSYMHILNSRFDIDVVPKNNCPSCDDNRCLRELISLLLSITVRYILKYQCVRGILLWQMQPDCSPDAIFRKKSLKTN